MHPQIIVKHSVGNVIEIPNELNSKVFTYMSNNVAIGATSIPVDNAIDFSAGVNLLLFSSIGSENCEFGYTTAHTDQAFTVTALKQPHNRGDLVIQVNYDQVVILKSSTLGGTYTTLQTLTLSVTQQKTVAFDTVGIPTDYYKVQWKNSQTNAISPLSDPISVISYPENSAGELINSVITAMGVSSNDPKINTQFLISALNDARRFTQSNLYGVRHAWTQNFEYPLRVLSGTNFVNLPTDIDFKETDRSLLSARFIQGNVLAPYNLKYIDKRSWNQIAFQISGGITATDTAISATQIDLNSVGDFPASSDGVAYVATTAFNQTLLQIAYTGVDTMNNRLTGVTGVTRAFPAGTQIWVTPTIAQPINYTVYDDKIVFDRIIPDSMQGNNCYIDYYKKIDKVENLYQELPEPYRDIYTWYLRYAIKYRKDITLSSSDPDLVKFNDLVKALFDNLYTGQDTVIVTS